MCAEGCLSNIFHFHGENMFVIICANQQIFLKKEFAKADVEDDEIIVKCVCQTD